MYSIGQWLKTILYLHFFFFQVETETQKDEGKIEVNELCTTWQPSHHDNVLYWLVYSLKFGVRVYHPWYHPFPVSALRMLLTY